MIRALAITLNDNMPPGVRERLKPFAPRIVGTNDRWDDERAKLLLIALAEEIRPRLVARHDLSVPRRSLGRLWRVFCSLLGNKHFESEVDLVLYRAVTEDDYTPHALAGAVGRLLVRAAREASSTQEANRLWDIAIGGIRYIFSVCF
jgi:hypothetical protein